MIRSTLIALALLGAAGSLASAEQRAAPQAAAGPDPAQQAIVQMLQEGQAREAEALAQVYALRARLNAEKGRADAAEEKLKKVELAVPPAAPGSSTGEPTADLPAPNKP